MLTCLLSEFTSVSPAALSPSSHITCVYVFLLFSPQFPIFLLHAFVLPNIMYSPAVLHFTPSCSFVLFSIICMCFFSLANALPPLRATLYNLITSSITLIPSPPLTHTITPISSFHYNLQPPTPTALGSQYL